MQRIQESASKTSFQLRRFPNIQYQSIFRKQEFHLPVFIFQGIVQGPEEFAEGVALGMRSLFGHAVGKLAVKWTDGRTDGVRYLRLSQRQKSLLFRFTRRYKRGDTDKQTQTQQLLLTRVVKPLKSSKHFTKHFKTLFKGLQKGAKGFKGLQNTLQKLIKLMKTRNSNEKYKKKIQYLKTLKWPSFANN